MANASSLVSLKPAVLRWARERVGLDQEQLAGRLRVNVDAVVKWEDTGDITYSRADALAKSTYTPYGYLFGKEPPDESLPIADFRTGGNGVPERPSINLLDTVYQMQGRQMWMTDDLICEEEDEPLDFVGAYSVSSQPQVVAKAMSDGLNLEGGWASVEGSWRSALRTLHKRIDDAGVMVVVNGIVGNNTHRKLDPNEFQGFALVDQYAPLIFINNADYKSVQMFTLAHELAHIFVGATGVSGFDDLQPTGHPTEEVCNEIAAEFLVPMEEFIELWPTVQQAGDPIREIAKHFKVSTVIAARRALDAELIERRAFLDYYEENKAHDWGRAGSGIPRSLGNYWINQRMRVGWRFGARIYRSVKEGKTMYTEAYSLTDLNGAAFEMIPEKLGFRC